MVGAENLLNRGFYTGRNCFATGHFLVVPPNFKNVVSLILIDFSANN